MLRSLSAVAAAALTLSVAGQAQAQWQYIQPLACPVPTDAECVDATYQQSYCGKENIAQGACNTALVNSMQTLPTYGYGYAPNATGDSYVYADTLAPTPTTSDYDVSFGAGYVGELGGNSAEVRNPSLASWLWWKPSAAAKRAAWNANGHQVASCEELTYEGWYTYSLFDDEVARRGPSSRAIFQAARDTGLAYTGIVARDGSQVVRKDGSFVGGLPFPTEKIPKNAYFLFEKTAFDKDFITAGAVPSAAGLSYYTADWQWHMWMSEIFGYWAPDDFLDSEYERQKKFLKLLEKRAMILDDLVADAADAMTVTPGVLTESSYVGETSYRIGIAPLSSFAAATINREVSMVSTSAITSVIETSMDPSSSVAVFTGGYTGNMAKLFVIDRKINAELERAASYGCLDTTTPSVCDWSPRLFADLIGEAYVKEREEDYQRCMYLTGDDFSPGSPIASPSTYGIVSMPGTATAYLGRAFLTNYEDYLENIDFTPEPGNPSSPSIGWWRDGSRWLGNDDFGAGYSYLFGFGLVKGDAVGGGCVMNFKAQARAYASARVAGQSIELLDSDTYGITDSDTTFRVQSHTQLLDVYDLYSPVDRVLTATDTLPLWHINEQWAAAATFWIGPVPVTGEIGVAGSAGLDLASTVSMDRRCYSSPKLDITGAIKVTPTLHASAFIGAMVGIKGLGAGLRTDLTIAHVEAPLTVTASVHGSGATLADLERSTRATVNVLLGLTVDSLSGSLSGVVETPFKTWRRTIFAWEGKRLVDETWERTWAFPVGVILSKLGT